MQSRDVDRQGTAPLPPSVQAVGQRVSAATADHAYDQVTVNDYPPSVGLAPHIDTHSAFSGTVLWHSLHLFVSFSS